MFESLEESIWFKRKFGRIEDNKLLPNIVERLLGTPARVAQKVRNVSVSALEVSIDRKWSVKEEIGHLIDLETLWIGRIIDFMEEKKILRDADLTNKKTNEAEHNRRSTTWLIRELTTQRARLMNSLELLEADDLERELLHPRLKTPMRIIDLLYFVAEHDDHHLARITRILDKLDL